MSGSDEGQLIMMMQRRKYNIARQLARQQFFTIGPSLLALTPGFQIMAKYLCGRGIQGYAEGEPGGSMGKPGKPRDSLVRLKTANTLLALSNIDVS